MLGLGNIAKNKAGKPLFSGSVLVYSSVKEPEIKDKIP
jgi:hypothetical protein